MQDVFRQYNAAGIDASAATFVLHSNLSGVQQAGLGLIHAR